MVPVPDPGYLVAMVTVFGNALALVLLGVGAGMGGEDVGGALAALRADSAERREEAQRQLSRELDVQHLALVSDAILGGDAEVGRRLRAALGSSDGHLGLAALLSTEDDPRLAEVGRAAIGERLAAWTGSLDDMPLPARRMPEEWLEESRRPLRMDPLAGDVADLVDRLSRLGRGPAPLVLDPQLDPDLRTPLPGPIRRLVREPLTGPWVAVVEGLVRARRVSFEVLGHREDDGFSLDEDEALIQAPARSWVRIGLRGELGKQSTRGLVVLWCQELARFGSAPARRAAHARALAALGWPAALAWMERLWLEQDDDASLAGLLHAASRGWVVPSLLEPERVAQILAELERQDREPREEQSFEEARLRRQAESTGRALSTIGPTGRLGKSLEETLWAGWDDSSAVGRWARLVGFEGYATLGKDGRQRLRELLASGADAALRLQAARVLGRVGGGEALELSRPAELFVLASSQKAAAELASALVRARVGVPGGGWWRSVSWEPGAIRALLDWSLGGGVGPGARELASDALRALLARPGSAMELDGRARLALAEGQEALLRGLLQELAQDPDPALARRAWRLGLVVGLEPDQGARERLDAILARNSWQPADLFDLGILGAHPQWGWRAREALVSALERPEADASALAIACSSAHRGLLRQGEDDLAKAFRLRLRGASARLQHPLSPTFRDPEWPGPLQVSLQQLERQDRILGQTILLRSGR